MGVNVDMQAPHALMKPQGERDAKPEAVTGDSMYTHLFQSICSQAEVVGRPKKVLAFLVPLILEGAGELAKHGRQPGQVGM